MAHQERALQNHLQLFGALQPKVTTSESVEHRTWAASEAAYDHLVAAGWLSAGLFWPLPMPASTWLFRRVVGPLRCRPNV